ncbi:MAG: hypothetical protein ABIT16_12555 [Croceibacterium sp.]
MIHRLLACAAALALCGPIPAAAQSAPADLTMLPAVPTDYAVPRTEWGDPDLRAIYTLDNINAGRVSFERPASFGDRFWLTDEEFAKRVDDARASDAAFDRNNTRGTSGLEQWMLHEPFARRTAMLVDPPSGKLPALRPEAEALRLAGHSSWKPDSTYDWVGDFDLWDRCVTRGFPASMLPFRYNNGVRVFQGPGYVVIHFEMLGDRVIPIGKGGHWPAAVRTYLGDSRGRWEGNTLVVETTNVITGDNATPDVSLRAASPLNQATQGVPAWNSIPVSDKAKAVERFTMTAPGTLTYELTYSDPEVFTAPWTARTAWTRDDDYQFFEYACHEGNVQVRNYIIASRTARRTAAAQAAGGPSTSGQSPTAR